MLLDVPEPVWKISIGNCASCSPAATASAALRMDAACAPDNRPNPALTSAAAPLINPRAPQRVGGDLQLAHAVVLDAETARPCHVRPSATSRHAEHTAATRLSSND